MEQHHRKGAQRGAGKQHLVTLSSCHHCHYPRKAKGTRKKKIWACLPWQRSTSGGIAPPRHGRDPRWAPQIIDTDLELLLKRSQFQVSTVYEQLQLPGVKKARCLHRDIILSFFCCHDFVLDWGFFELAGHFFCYILIQRSLKSLKLPSHPCCSSFRTRVHNRAYSAMKDGRNCRRPT